MSLRIIEHEDGIEEPTDHPHVFPEQAPTLPEEDGDIQRYNLSFSGSGGAVRFFASVLQDRIGDNLYRHYENAPDGTPSFLGIRADDIDEVIDIFDQTVNEIGEIKLTGTIDGKEYHMPLWDGELAEETIFD